MSSRGRPHSAPQQQANAETAPDHPALQPSKQPPQNSSSTKTAGRQSVRAPAATAPVAGGEELHVLHRLVGQRAQRVAQRGLVHAAGAAQRAAAAHGRRHGEGAGEEEEGGGQRAVEAPVQPLRQLLPHECGAALAKRRAHAARPARLPQLVLRQRLQPLLLDVAVVLLRRGGCRCTMEEVSGGARRREKEHAATSYIKYYPQGSTYLDVLEVRPQARPQEGVGAKGLDPHKPAQAHQLHPALAPEAGHRRRESARMDSFLVQAHCHDPQAPD